MAFSFIPLREGGEAPLGTTAPSFPLLTFYVSLPLLSARSSNSFLDQIPGKSVSVALAVRGIPLTLGQHASGDGGLG